MRSIPLAQSSESSTVAPTAGGSAVSTTRECAPPTASMSVARDLGPSGGENVDPNQASRYSVTVRVVQSIIIIDIDECIFAGDSDVTLQASS